MRKRIALYIGILVVVGGGVLAYPVASMWWHIQSLPPAADRTASYNADVLPILEAHCYQCHGDGKRKGMFNMDERDGVLRSGDAGPIVAEGDSANSELIHRVAAIAGKQIMPPGDRDPLTAEQIGILRAWIDQGVNWTSEN